MKNTHLVDRPLRFLALIASRAPGASALALLTATSLLCAPLSGSERVALVVGNNDYVHGVPLRNAVSDSRLIGETLKKCGFEVISVENADMAKFSDGLDQFKIKAATANLGLVFFAGHGIEVDGKNFLLPVDSALEESSQLRFQAVGVEAILRDMVDIRLPAKMLILDCCRNNPLKREWLLSRSVNGGLAPLTDKDLPEMSLIMYSASPGQVSYDGEGSFSPFSLALSKSLIKPGHHVLDALYEAADHVLDATGRKQEPWVRSDGSAQGFRRLVFIPEGGATPSAPQPAPRPADGVSPDAFSAAPMSLAQGLGNNLPPSSSPDSPLESPGNTQEAPEMATVLPKPLPERGFYTKTEVFEGGPYAGYNDYAKGQILRSAQSKLPGAGSADGQMGRNTQNAIMAFQASRSIMITGLLDAATLAALELVDIAEATYVAPAKKYSSSSGKKSSGTRSSGGSSRSSSGGGGGGSIEGRAAAAAARAVLGF